jgi:hypothetical protein
LINLRRMGKQRIPDPVIKSTRVYKNKKDQAKQAVLDGADTSFQRALRMAEAQGKKTFMWRDPKTGKSKSYAARTGTGKTLATPPPTVRAQRPPLDAPPPPGQLYTLPYTDLPEEGFPETTPEESGTTGRRRTSRFLSGQKQQRVNGRKVKNITPTGTKKKGKGGF